MPEVNENSVAAICICFNDNVVLFAGFWVNPRKKIENELPLQGTWQRRERGGAG
jgi:hypothetical protein